MKNNKKGFTLIELLAVIVVLSLLMLVASTNVWDLLTKARKRTFRNEFLSLLESADMQASIDMMDGSKLVKNGSCYCYAIGDLSTFTNSKNYKGNVCVWKDEKGLLHLTGTMANDEYMIVEKTRDLKEEDVVSFTAIDTSINAAGSSKAKTGVNASSCKHGHTT